MRKIIVLAFFSVFLIADTMEEIQQNIDKNKTKLQETAQKEKQISSRLSVLGNTINERKKQIESIQAQIKLLQSNITQNKTQSQNQERKLVELKKMIDTLESKKQKIQTYIVNLIASDLAFGLVLDNELLSPDDIILEDIFKALTKQSQAKILALNEQRSKIEKQSKNILSNINEISLLIDSQQARKNKLQALLVEQKQLHEKLKIELQDYNQRLVQISKERNSLDAILNELNIVKANKQKEIERARLEEQRRKQAEQHAQTAQPKPQTQQQPQKPESKPQAQEPKVASATSGVSVIKYTGEKTIAPLDSYTIDQNFGSYYDPVYNLKVFNESVTLLSKTQNAVVYSIFDGKVVYAKEAPILKKVIIIEHANQLYSIYSQLDKIAPTIKPGFIVKKGYTIGRTSGYLGLEITQRDKHINPLEVIAKSK